MEITLFLDYFFVFLILLTLIHFLRKTGTVRVVSGILVIFLFSYLTSFLGFHKTSYLLDLGFQILTLGLILIFAPELRLFLRKIGDFPVLKHTKVTTLQIIENTLFELSKNKIGALIVYDKNDEIGAITENSVAINGKISAPLLQTIFHPNTPLHDGAVLINQGYIRYAGCKLPLAAQRREEIGDLGTRHLVALETAENFDTIVFIVSEETGKIRIATKDGLTVINSRKDFKDFFNKENKSFNLSKK